MASPAIGLEPPAVAYGHRAKVYAPSGVALCVGGTLLTAAAAVGLKVALLDKAAWSFQSASIAVLVVAAALLLTSGFLAGWSARKLCVLEVLTAVVVAGALAHAPWVPVILYHQPWPLGVDTQIYEMWALVGIEGIGLLLFLGSSMGFMLAGGGELDLRFRYELFVALTFLRLLGKDRARSAGVAGVVVLVAVLGWPVLLFISLFSKARRPSPSMLVTGIATYAVATGVIALTVVLSVMSGFELDLKKKILGTNAHAVVLKYGADFREYQDVRKNVLAVPGVIGATPFTLNEVMVSSESNLSGVVLKGIDAKTVNSVTEIGKNVEEGDLSWLDNPGKIPLPPTDEGGSLGQMTERLNKLLDEEDELDRKNGIAPKPRVKAPPKPEPKPVAPLVAKPAAPAGPPLPGIVIGRELAHSLRVFVGDTVHVVSPLSNELGPTGPIPKSRPFRVAALFFSGMYEYDSKFAYISLPEAQKYFSLDGAVTGLELKVNDIDATRRITRDILFKLDGYPYHTKDWGEMNHNLFAALAMEKLVMAIILGFASLPVGWLILAILMFLTFEKSKEIAVLKSMGARDQSVMKIFVMEGLVIGGIGAALGLVAGLLICLFIAHGGIKLDPSVYYIEALPVRIEGWQFAVVALSAVTLSYLATIYPALGASRLAPVEGLRNE